MTSEMISSRALWMLLVIYTVLVVGSLIAFYLTNKNPEKDYTELRLRIQSWWVIIVIFTVAISLYRSWGIIFWGFVSFLALKEFLSAIPTRRADRRVLFFVYLMIPAQYWLIHKYWYGLYIILIPVYGLIVISVATTLTGQVKGFLQAVSTLHWGAMITIFSLSHLAFLLALPAGIYPNVTGATLLLYVVFLVQFNDVAQYVCGKIFGQHKVIPAVSPNKTWEGLIGGVITTACISAVIGPYLSPLDFMESLMMGAVLGMTGFFGDVTLSALKRDLGIKDTSNFLPGHGGVLDRVDSLSIVAPVFFHFLHYMKY